MILLILVFLGACSILAISANKSNTPSEKYLNKWFNSAPLYIKEKATGYYRGNFHPFNEYEEFKYVSSIYWYSLSFQDKLRTYHRVLSYYQKNINKNSYAPKNNYDSFGSE